MAKQSGFLKRQQEHDMMMQVAARETFGQYDADTAIVALSEVFGFGYERIMRFLIRWTEIRNEYDGALNPKKDHEGDIKQAHLDRDIRAIMENAGREAEFIDFEKRYPLIRTLPYKPGVWKI